VIFILPMMMFGAYLAVFDEVTRNIARFIPNFHVTDSLSVIFHMGGVSDPVIWQNLLILAGISLVVVLAGILIFKRTVFREGIDRYSDGWCSSAAGTAPTRKFTCQQTDRTMLPGACLWRPAAL